MTEQQWNQLWEDIANALIDGDTSIALWLKHRDKGITLEQVVQWKQGLYDAGYLKRGVQNKEK